MSINKRKCLYIHEKVEIIRELERGEKNVEVCKKFNLSPSTVSTLWKNKEVILSALENNPTTNKKLRICDFGNVDQALLECFFIGFNLFDERCMGHCYPWNGDKLFPEIWFIIRRIFRW
jgi:hypothetical protein